jgi:hypothetical protein
MLLTGMPTVPTNEAQVEQIKNMEKFLEETMDKDLEWAIDFGAMYLNTDVGQMERVVEFIRNHPETVEFDNLNPLRARLHAFWSYLTVLAGLLKPEQFDHEVKIPEAPAPNQNGEEHGRILGQAHQ